MQESIIHNEVTVVVLTGGRSLRMGKDKGGIHLSGKSFVSHLLEVAKSFATRVLLSVGTHNEKQYRNLDTPIIIDIESNKGPIGGIISVLPQITTAWFLVISVDTPLVNYGLLQKLWQHRNDKDGVVFTHEDRIHPLVGLYKTTTKHAWVDAFNNGNLKVTSLVKSFKLKCLNATHEDLACLQNINTPQDYSSLKEEVK